mmetsp:Transcript_12227/g.18133  ORF Transcript_12227/g.18133 Transcript_12227/m.18133 type:complete len:208 (+) Transcript_12227:1288-1911(+)
MLLLRRIAHVDRRARLHVTYPTAFNGGCFCMTIRWRRRNFDAISLIGQKFSVRTVFCLLPLLLNNSSGYNYHIRFADLLHGIPLQRLGGIQDDALQFILGEFLAFVIPLSHQPRRHDNQRRTTLPILHAAFSTCFLDTAENKSNCDNSFAASNCITQYSSLQRGHLGSLSNKAPADTVEGMLTPFLLIKVNFTSFNISHSRQSFSLA